VRILLLSDRIPPENVGGAEKIAWALAMGLRDAGHEVHVIAATLKASFQEARDGIPTYHIHSRVPARLHPYLSLYNPQTLGQLKSLFAQIQPDVLNAHNIHTHLSYSALTLAYRMGIPTVFTSHDVMPFAYNRLTHFVDPARCGVQSPEQYKLPPFYNLRQMRLRYNPFRNWLIRYVLTHHARARTCVSEAHRQALEANGLPPFRVVRNGIAAEQFQTDAASVAALQSRLGLENRQVILFAGRLSPDKGAYQLIAALKQLIKTVPGAALLVLSRAGLDEQGLNTPDYRQLCEGGHIVSGGWMSGDELAAAYGLADIVTVPSICLDCFPTINLEAMAAGKLVVATCYGGSPESVIDGETGYVVNPFDIAALAERLERLLTDENLRLRMGAAARKRINDHFTLSHQVEQMVSVYQGVRGGE
jgi:glycosyltransferase involved in cell wall biosynthesis